MDKLDIHILTICSSLVPIRITFIFGRIFKAESGRSSFKSFAEKKLNHLLDLNLT